eukprot:gene23026-biopygen4283
MNYFMRLTDTGCRNWRVWEVRAAVLVLAGYPVRCVAFAAAGALRRRGERLRAVALQSRWMRNGVLVSWRRAVVESGAVPNDQAFVNRIVAQCAAGIRREERGIWASAAGECGFIRGTCEGGLSRVADGKNVRFSI